MSEFQRFAVYYMPDDPALADFGAAWLGWDAERAKAVDHLAVENIDLAAITETPRKYGFHGTLKPPFRLSEGSDVSDVLSVADALAADQPSVETDGMTVAALGHFAAIVPSGGTAALAELAARCVRDLDHLRAPPTDAELARRRAAGLSEAQEANLTRWGYPYVMDEFRFHLTLSGRLDPDTLRDVTDAASRHLPEMPRPFPIRSISVVGERADGRFEAIQRYALSG